MTTTMDGPSDSSVTFSLSELVELEQQRIRDERARDASAARHHAEAQRREAEKVAAAEAERRGRDAEAKREGALRDAEERARLEGRARAEIDVARIGAEAKARLEADSAARAHEIALLRERLDRRAVRGRGLLVGLLAITVAAAAAFVVTTRGREARLVDDMAYLRSTTSEVTAQRDDARAELRRYAQNGETAATREAEAKAARLASLDGRRTDLAGWANDRRRADLLDDVADAAANARRNPDASNLATYAAALDTARARLLSRGAPAGAATTTTTPDPVPKKDGRACTNPADPLCGLDGRAL